MKTVLITGGNKGIGFETAKLLLNKGLFVYIGSRDMEKGDEAVKELNNNGFQSVKAVVIDVTDLETILSVKSIIQNEQGKLDILINNAGILGNFPQSATDVSIEILKDVYETNVYGVIRVTQNFLDLLKKSDEPRIVNVSSSLGSLTLHSDPSYPFYNVKPFAYNSSKTALNMFTVHLAYELKDTVFKVNSVCPGYTDTDFGNHIGTGKVEDAAKRLVKYALIDNDGPTGRFFSEETNPNTDEIAW
ncbi:SDR family oxidoreductase [Sphingobacterium athyrii]|uniref:Short-chain dehydrogenase n=1 Tax=Sphingobacterium athyrii TaxID=2152717 RepID=A0A363NUS2_9SPHI|nr:SDR family oxidoreductase [Sphingobacterium athyrii]PUV24529.1 short-chain dehydrogenase [Sphingobacterium athyrii]